MVSMRKAVAVVALALALAGCGEAAQSGAGAQSSSSAPVTTTTVAGTPPVSSSSAAAPPPASAPVSITGTSIVVPPGVQQVPADHVDASALPDYYTKQAWTFGNGRDVQVFGVAGGCKEAKAEVTGESADSVHITLVTVTTQPPSGAVCTQEIRNVPLVVHLSAPLGDRNLVLEARQENG
jgi:hypothetical protein